MSDSAMSANPLDSLPPELRTVIELALSAFIQQELPSIYIIIVASLWLGVSFCLFMALLYSSTPKSRRTPLFMISVIAVGFGTIPSILFLKLLVDAFAKALSIIQATEIKPYIFALSFFSYFSSICVDSILLFRLVAVFPPSRTSPRQLAAVFGPLLAVKVGRVATVITLVVHYIKRSQMLPSEDSLVLYLVVQKLPEPKVAWGLQLLDNGICSFLFLYKLHQTQSFITRLKTKSSYIQRLQTLFLIAISNFVFPVIFAILQLIFFTRNLSYQSLASINISGTNIEVIGVLFATIWAGQVIEGWRNENDEESRGSARHSTHVSFATRQATFLSTRATGHNNDYDECDGYTSTTGTRSQTSGMCTSQGTMSTWSADEGKNIGLKEMKLTEI